MKLILKLITLQAFWFLAVVGGPVLNDIFIYLVAILLVVFNFIIFKPKISQKKYFFLALIFVLYGALEGALVTSLKLANFPGGSYPLWMNSLFLIFICYYGDAFNKFQNLKMMFKFLIGGTGGALAYYSGSRFGSIIIGDSDILFSLFIFVSWGIFFVLSFNLFYDKNPLESNG